MHHHADIEPATDRTDHDSRGINEAKYVRICIMRLVPALSFRLDDPAGTPVDPRLLPLLEAIAASASLAAAVEARGISYRAAWGMLRDWRVRLGVPLVLLERGRGARLTAAGRRLLEAHQAAGRRLADVLPALAVEIGGTPRTASRAAPAHLKVAASHDFALVAFAGASVASDRLELDLSFMGSLRALEELDAGRVPVAGFHVPVGARGARELVPYLRFLDARRDRLVRFVDRDQGLILPRGNPLRVRTLSDVAARGLRFVNRQRGSGTRLVVDQLLARAKVGAREVAGYDREEFTHAAVAATVASGGADAGFGLCAAAAEYGLAFVPVMRERYFLAVRARDVDTPALARLRAALRTPAFAARVAGIPGYGADGAGALIGIAALTTKTRDRATP
jgi:molybdate transport repressor ModE-like protein